MSVFYATFSDHRLLGEALDELLRGGVRPDDLSVIVSAEAGVAKSAFGLLVSHRTVGDATSYVGRTDDPIGGVPRRRLSLVSELTTVDASDIQGVDTSRSSTDVESIDQADESQSEAELALDPLRYTSQSTHEADEVSHEAMTGFPTPPPDIDDVRDQQDELQEQFVDSFESFDLDGFGFVMGGGELATAALTSNAGDLGAIAKAIRTQLREDGVSVRMADIYEKAIGTGEALLAVAIVPGRVNEGWVESVAERHHAGHPALVDAPRY